MLMGKQPVKRQRKVEDTDEWGDNWRREVKEVGENRLQIISSSCKVRRKEVGHVGMQLCGRVGWGQEIERMKLGHGSFTRTSKSLRIRARVGETISEMLRSSISERPGGHWIWGRRLGRKQREQRASTTETLDKLLSRYQVSEVLNKCEEVTF